MNRFSDSPKKEFVVKTGKGGIAVYDQEFIDDIQRSGIRSPKEKKDIVQMIRDEGGVPDNISDKMKYDFDSAETIKYAESLLGSLDDDGAEDLLEGFILYGNEDVSSWAKSKLEKMTSSNFSKNALNKTIQEYDDLWNSDEPYNLKEIKAIKFLDKKSKSNDVDISEWAGKEIHEIYMDKKTESDERNMEDMSFYTGDPDAGAPDGTEFSRESLKVAEDALETMLDKGAKEEEINSYLSGMSKMDDKDVSKWAKEKLTEGKEESFEYDNEQMAMGIEVEKEHKPTYEMIEDYYTKNQRMPPETNVYQAIAEDHLRDEHPKYYTYLMDAEELMKRDLENNS